MTFVLTPNYRRRVKWPGPEGAVHAASLSYKVTVCGLGTSNLVRVGDNRVVTCLICIAEGS